MKLKTQVFQEACKTILLAVDNTTANLELVVKEDKLYLNVTNRETYVSIKYQLEQPESFHAVVNASLFLNLISGITVSEFDLNVVGNTVVVKAGKSSYKLALIYENDTLMALPEIKILNVTVDMPISVDILQSIVNVNSKEMLKLKNADVNELQKLYYIDETGCFTFNSGACLNSFTLEKPIKMLLNERVVKLFKLFKQDVHFSFGYDTLPNGALQAKAVFETPDIYLGAIITNDDKLISTVQGPCIATKNFISEKYPISAVFSVEDFSAALARLMQFTKNSSSKINIMTVYVKIEFTNDEITISDAFGNSEVVMIENGSYVGTAYDMSIKLFDLKLVLDACKDQHITMNCGNNRSVVLHRGNISNLIPEGKR